MKQKKELVKNTIIIFIGKACTQFISLLLLPLYTAVLSQADYGFVDLVTTYVTLIVPLITLQLETATFRFLIDARNDEEQQSKIITNSFFTCIFTSVLVSCVAFIINIFLKVPYFLYIVALVFCTLLSNFVLQVARGKGKNIDYSVASTIIGVSTIILNLIFLLYFKTGVVGMLLAQTISNLIGYLYIWIKEKLYLNLSIKKIQKKNIAELLKYSLPLVPNGLIWWIINASDRTIISIVLDVAANGIYAVSNKFSTIIVQLYNVFNLSWTESASVHIQDKDKDIFFSETFNSILKLFSSIGILMIGFMPFIFNIMVDKGYNEAYNYIPLLIIGTFFNIIVSFIGGIYVALKRTKDIAITSLSSGIINILINILLINEIEIYAAAVSTIVAFLTMSIYRFVDVQKYVKLKINPKVLISIIFCFSISIFMYFQNGTFMHIMLATFSVIIAIAFNKGMIVGMYKSAKKKFMKKSIDNIS